MLTKKQAMLIIDAHEIHDVLINKDEVDGLKQNNPELLEAYLALCRIAGIATKKRSNTNSATPCR